VTPSTPYPLPPAVTPPPPVGAVPDYRYQYLALIETWSCALERFRNETEYIIGEDGFFTEDEWPSIREPLNQSGAAMAAATVQAIEGFVAAEWPEDVARDIDSLIEALSTEAGLYDQMAGAETIEQWYLIGEGAEHDYSADAIVRAKLGLPSNITAPNPLSLPVIGNATPCR